MLSDAEIVESLSARYGFRIPLMFAQFIRFNLEAWENANYQEYYSCVDRRYDVLLFYLRGLAGQMLAPELVFNSGRYFHTPLELFPFGGNGCDGIHYGYVIHAPELQLNDYPIGEFSPMDGTGVSLIGSTTRAAFECFISETLAYYDECLDLSDVNEVLKKELIVDLARTLMITPTPTTIRQNYETPIIPDVPDGWHYEPSGDGVGVLAPKAAFAPDTLTLQTWSFDPRRSDDLYYVPQDTAGALNAAKLALNQNYPATALFILREAYWRDPDGDVFAAAVELWQHTYFELGRPLLAQAVLQELPERLALKQAMSGAKTAYVEFRIDY
jgi:hypothetical protein